MANSVQAKIAGTPFGRVDYESKGPVPLQPGLESTPGERTCELWLDHNGCQLLLQTHLGQRQRGMFGPRCVD
jgi:hypothetical protein